jgi:hypothetical protein
VLIRNIPTMSKGFSPVGTVVSDHIKESLGDPRLRKPVNPVVPLLLIYKQR